MKDIKTVTVLGANGAMGYSISAVFAAWGDCKVYMVARKLEAAQDGAARAVKIIKNKDITANLFPMNYDALPDILPESDLIFESVAEDMNIKRDISAKIAQYAKPDTILGTGTSGLSITTLAECFEGELRTHYTGTHFFNPPNVLTLCEVIPTVHTDKAWLKEYKEYLAKVLGRAVVEVKDEAGFLGNRIGFQFMNEALQAAETYKDKGGIDYIDALIGPFTGRSMAPIATADFVGLDVHKAIVDNLMAKTADYANATFALPGYVQGLIDAGSLGRKAGIGLYQTLVDADGNKSRKVYDIATGTYRDIAKYDLPYAKAMIDAIAAEDVQGAIAALKADGSDEAKLCLTFLLKYVLYSVVTSKEVAERVNDGDTAMVSGFGWAPALGFVTLLGGVEATKALMKTHLDAETLAKVNIDEALSGDLNCEYPYAKYFKAKA